MKLDIDLSPAGTLLEEIERYLAAVDLFRAEGCKLEWIDYAELW